MSEAVPSINYFGRQLGVSYILVVSVRRNYLSEFNMRHVAANTSSPKVRELHEGGGAERRHDPRKNDLGASGFAELPPGPAKLVSDVTKPPAFCLHALHFGSNKNYLAFISTKNLFF